MISDICSEAMDEIEAYQTDFPDKYHSLRVEINNVRLVLDSLRLYLDTLPRPDAPPYTAARRRLKKALAELDVSGLLLAANQMWANHPDPPEASDKEECVNRPALKKSGGRRSARQEQPPAPPQVEDGAGHAAPAA